MTITAAVPRPERCGAAESASKSISMVSDSSAVIIRNDEPPETTAFRLPQPPRTPPQCSSMSCFSGMLIASSTLHGLFTWPEMQNTLVPALLGRPKLANHLAPRRKMVGTTAIDSTLFTVVGQP